MKAISIKNPWAWAIIYAGKPVENRTWASHYTGTIYIHVSKTFDFSGYNWLVKNQYLFEAELPHPDSYFFGGIIGKVNMIDCVSYHPSPFFFGPWGHVYDDPEPLPFFPCKGKLGIFEVDYADKN